MIQKYMRLAAMEMPHERTTNPHVIIKFMLNYL